MREISTDLQVLMTPAIWKEVAEELGPQLIKAGYLDPEIYVDEVVMSCEPDNMLVTQYEQNEGHQPTTEVLHHVVIHGKSAMELKEATRIVASALPEKTYWYGTSLEGHIELGGAAACAWRP